MVLCALVHRRKIGNRYVDRVYMYGIAPRLAPYLAYGSAISMFARARRPDETRSLWKRPPLWVDHLSFKYKEVCGWWRTIVSHVISHPMRIYLSYLHVTRHQCDEIARSDDHRVGLSMCFSPEIHRDNFPVTRTSYLSDAQMFSILIHDKSRMLSWAKFVNL